MGAILARLSAWVSPFAAPLLRPSGDQQPPSREGATRPSKSPAEQNLSDTGWQGFFPPSLRPSASPWEKLASESLLRPEGVWLLRYDNETGEGDHVRCGSKEKRHPFSWLSQLLLDIDADVPRLAR